jgi:hypothetical protein
MQSACAVLHCHLWPVRLYHIFPHYFINGTNFEKKKKISNIKHVFFPPQLLSETFLTLKSIQPVITNVHTSSCKIPVIFVIFYWDFIFLNIFGKKTSHISNVVKTNNNGSQCVPCGRTDMRKLSLFRRVRKIAESDLPSSRPSVRLSVRMEQLHSHWTDFHEIQYLRLFRKSVEKIQVSSKSDKNNGYFTRRGFHIYDNISSSSSYNEKF